MSSFPKTFSLFFSIVLILFSSCVNENPEATVVDYKIVYDFKDEASFPELRLSVFLEVENAVQKSSSLKLYHEESGLVWNCSSRALNKIESNNINWVGSTNFYPIKNELLPMGLYKVVYEDLAQRECEISFNLFYPEEFAKLTSTNIFDYFNSSVSKKIAIYSNEDILLYLGSEKSNWNSNESIIMEYKNAWSTRVCYSLNND